MDWLSSRLVRDPQYAQQEFEIRRQAAEIHRKLLEPGCPNLVTMAIYRPNEGYASEVSIHKSNVARVGGLEGLLIVEEIVRRANGLSVEAEKEERLEAARKAVGR